MTVKWIIHNQGGAGRPDVQAQSSAPDQLIRELITDNMQLPMYVSQYDITITEVTA